MRPSIPISIQPPGKRARSFDRRTAVFLYPALTFMIVVSLYTTIYSLYLALHDISLVKPPPYPFFGLQNFAAVFTDARAISAFGHSLQYVFWAVGIEFVLGVGIAVYLNHDFVGRGVVRALLLIPMIMTPVVAGLIWRIFYDPNAGLINYLMTLVNPKGGLDWLGSPQLAMGSLIVADVWQWTPFVILIAMASLDSMPAEPVEAALIDGATGIQMFRFVTLPLLWPTLVIALLLRLVDGFKAFDLIYVMTRGGPALATETANMYAYIKGFNTFNLSFAVAIAFILTLVVSFGLTTLYRLATRATQ